MSDELKPCPICELFPLSDGIYAVCEGYKENWHNRIRLTLAEWNSLTRTPSAGRDAVAEHSAKYAMAEAWASIDGNLDQFTGGRDADTSEQEQTKFGGRYEGYMEEAGEMIKRLASRGFGLFAQPPASDAMRTALEKAEEALSCCYDVCDYPANGRSPQDDAIKFVRAALAVPAGDVVTKS